MIDQLKEPTFSFFKSPVKNIIPTDELTIEQLHLLIIGENYRSRTDELRKTTDSGEVKRLKSQAFDYVCFSGTFEKRSNSSIKEYSGYLVLDFDDLTDITNVRERLINDDNIDLILLFTSPSGNGLKAVVQTDGIKSNHLKYFEAYSNYLRTEHHLELDPSGKDLSRACFLCYDSDCYITSNIKSEQKFIMSEWVNMNKTDIPQKNLFRSIEAAAKKAKEEKIDLTGDYNRWITVGFSLVSAFGEEGRSLFHEFSGVNEHYSPVETDEKYSNLLSSSGNGVTIKSLLFILGESGINVNLGSEPHKGAPNKIQKIENWINERYKLKHNELRGTIEVKKQKTNKWEVLNDRLFNSLLLELNRSGIKCSINILHSLLNSEFVESYNPFMEYLNKNGTWDGDDHIDKLSRTVTTSNSEFWNLSFKRWIVAFVASIINPRITNHQVIVLCGGQGIGKTTWILNLIPEELKDYVFSGTINPSNKDSVSLLAEMILINLDEMDNMNRSDFGTLKSLITMQQVTFRRAYGRFSETRPRIGSFIGSVNDRQFLNDPTGSRRFLVNEIVTIDYTAKIELSQVYLQALHLFKNGFKYFFDQEDIKIIEENNSTYQKSSLEEDLLLKYFEKVDWDDTSDYRTATEILQHFNSYSNLSLNQAHANQIGKVLSKNGFEKGKRDGVYKWAVKVKN
jgi:hypothetical protein